MKAIKYLILLMGISFAAHNNIYGIENSLRIPINFAEVDSIIIYENCHVYITGIMDRETFMGFVSTGDIKPETLVGDKASEILTDIVNKCNDASRVIELSYNTFEIVLECDYMFREKRPTPLFWQNKDQSKIGGCIVIYYKNDIDLLWFGKDFIDLKFDRYFLTHKS